MKAIYPIIILILLSLLFFNSCKKTEEIIDDTPLTIEKPCWNLHPDIELDRRLLIQSFTTDDHLYLLSNNYFLKMDENGLVEDFFISEEGNLSFYDYPMLNDKLFAVGLDVNGVEKFKFHSSQKPELFDFIDFKAIDSSFIKINYRNGNGLAVNSANKLLIPIRKEIADDDGHTYLWMFDCVIEDDNLSIEFDQEVKILFGGAGLNFNSKIITEMSVIGEDFYCSFDNPNRTYKVNSQGQTKSIFPYRDAMFFERNDTIFSMMYNPNCSASYAFKTEQSLQWDIHSISYEDGCGSRFYMVDDQLVIARSRNIYHLKIDFKTNDFEWKELDQSCLGASNIRSISYFKNKVYMARLDGLYWKDKSDFFIYKED